MLIIFKRTIYFLFSTMLLVPLVANGQEEVKGDSLLQNATLDSVIQYTLLHQPFVQQSLLDQEIINKTIKGKLADWYPQINFSYSFQRNIDFQRLLRGKRNTCSYEVLKTGMRDGEFVRSDRHLGDGVHARA